MLGIDYFAGDPVYIHTEEGFDRQVWMDKAKRNALGLFDKWVKGVHDIYGKSTW